MSTGTLQQSGNVWKLILEKKNSITIPKYYNIPKELDGKEVQYELNQTGQLREIYYNGNELPRNSEKNREQKTYDNPLRRRELVINRKPFQNERNKNTDRQENFATAPYNFIPLPNKIVPAPEVDLDFSSFQDWLLSGYIDLSIEAKTDIFIRGEMEKFFFIKDRPTIPGSSMRGLIRSMVEIMSFSKISFTEKKTRRYFYRNISDTHYKEQFLRTNPQPIKIKSKGAYLVKRGRQYLLYPMELVYRVDMNRHPLLNTHVNPLKKCYSQSTVWFDPNSVQKIRNRGNLQLEYNLLHGVVATPQDGFHKGVLVRTGLFGGNKHYQWIFPEFIDGPYENVTEFMEDVYATDENRDPSANLIELSKEGKPIPCFYLEDKDGKPEYIGHTGIFRIPYKKTLGDFIPKHSPSDLDITESLFGFITQDGKNKSGKVFFEDSLYTAGNPSSSFAPLKILSSPKPTSWQLYLDQDNGRTVNWDSDNARIRGQKMYWHRVGAGWENEDQTLRNRTRQDLIQVALIDRKTQYTVADVVQKGAVFSGRIRFENLHPVELGALLAALKLPDECAHKIGMGKPHGMGSIKIVPTLHIITRKDRYKTFFENHAQQPIKLSICSNEGDIGLYVRKFAEHLCNELGTNISSNREWDYYLKNNARLKELYAMLVLEPRDNNMDKWNELTRYMQINEFKPRANQPRRILGRPSDYR